MIKRSFQIAFADMKGNPDSRWQRLGSSYIYRFKPGTNLTGLEYKRCVKCPWEMSLLTDLELSEYEWAKMENES